MTKIESLKQQIEGGLFPKDFPEFGGADLIITKNKNRKHREGDTVVYSEHAAALSWLVLELKKIYESDLDYLNKYAFYPRIGEIINETLVDPSMLIETMLHVCDEIEKEWGTR